MFLIMFQFEIEKESAEKGIDDVKREATCLSQIQCNIKLR